MGRMRILPHVVLASMFLLGPVAGVSARPDQPAEATPAVRYGTSIAVKPGVLTGRVIFTDGASPAAEVKVQLWSIGQGKFVQEVKTDKEGAYKLEGLVKGRYFIVVGGRVSVDLRVDESAKHAGPLNVIIPRGTTQFAQLAPERQAATLVLLSQTEQPPPPTPGVPLRTVLIIGGGTATAIGAIVVINEINEDHDDGHVVSP